MIEGISVKRNIYLIIAAFLVLFLILVFFAYFFTEHKIRTPLVSEKVETRIFEVKKGDSLGSIGRKLEDEKIISSGLLFKLYAKMENKENLLQAGKYFLSPDMSIADIVDKMAAGDVMFDTLKITVPEGFTLKDIDERIQSLEFENLKGKRLADFKVKDFQEEYVFLTGIEREASLEGFLFPDTYEFKKDASAEFIISNMLANFDKKFNMSMKQEAERKGKTIFNIVTMASILQQEVRTEEDMKIASGILWKRLDIGMPLQVDASVIYALGRNDVTSDDLKTDSPYNTYLYKGLPKGPISNPGEQALYAALYPTDSDYLYYISKKTGETVFSKTFSEHQKAINQYLR